MAFYKVLEVSFIGLRLCKVGEVVDINDDPAKGGMRPKGNLVACDEDGNVKAAKPAAKKVPTAADLG